MDATKLDRGSRPLPTITHKFDTWIWLSVVIVTGSVICPVVTSDIWWDISLRVWFIACIAATAAVSSDDTTMEYVWPLSANSNLDRLSSGSPSELETNVSVSKRSGIIIILVLYIIVNREPVKLSQASTMKENYPQRFCSRSASNTAGRFSRIKVQKWSHVEQLRKKNPNLRTLGFNLSYTKQAIWKTAIRWSGYLPSGFRRTDPWKIVHTQYAEIFKWIDTISFLLTLLLRKLHTIKQVKLLLYK